MDNFFFWYYSEGLRGFFRIWKNYLDFFWNFFSIGRFFRTLISPWRRDVSRVKKPGLHPILLLQALLENIVTRFLGLLVRLSVIFIGLFFEVFALIFGFLVLIFWIFEPVFLSIIVLGGAPSFIFFPSLVGIYTDIFSLLFLGSILILILSILSFSRSKKDYSKMSILELAQQKWFSRVWNRLGFSASDVDKRILSDDKKLEEFLRAADVSLEEFYQIVEWETLARMELERKKKFWRRENLMLWRPIGRYWNYAYTVKLDRFAEDLTQADFSQWKNSKLVGKDAEFKEMLQLLSRGVQNSVIVVGEPGMGRETLVHTLARGIREGKISAPLDNKRILELDVLGILSNCASSQEAENVLSEVLAEAAAAGNVILVLKDMHKYVGAEDKDISAVLSQFVAYPSFQIIGLTTPNGYHAQIEKKEEVMKYCEKIIFQEMEEKDVIRVMLNALLPQERKEVFFTYQSLRQIVRLSDKYMASAPFPEKALDLMEEVILHRNENPGGMFISSADVDATASDKFKVNIGEIEGGESEKLLHLEEALHQRVIGQDFAIEHLAEAMRRGRVGLSQKGKPLGSFLFLGPTGVGKTESAKSLAEAYFGSEDRMVRLDMSEYQKPDSIDRLIGSEQTGREGYLVSKIKDNPNTLLLLDEIEKAHKDILNLFLQVLDEGYLTDAFGKKINFSNLIIIATSNAGSDLIEKSLEKNIQTDELQKQLIDYVVSEGIFRPEFLNRFDDVIFFHPLSRENVEAIAKLLLEKYAANFKDRENILIAFAPGVFEKVAEEAYNPVFGAREVNRYIQEKIGSSVAKKIIAGEIKKGEDYVFKAEDMEG